MILEGQQIQTPWGLNARKNKLTHSFIPQGKPLVLWHLAEMGRNIS